MVFTFEYDGKRYSVRFFRIGLPSEVKVWTERPPPKASNWKTQWNSFSKRNPGPTVRKIIELATHLREAKLAFEPRFPLMD